MKVKKGSKVKIEYEGKLENGTVFDTSEGKAPLEIEIGTEKVIKGFEDALIDMEKGQEKEITLKPEQAYGDPNPNLVKQIPKDKLPKEKEPQVGMILVLKAPDGKQMPARITKVDDKEVTIDLNHPLAGKTLIFKIKVVDVS